MREMKGLKATFREDSKYVYFFLSILVMGLGYGLYKGTIDNYLAQIVQMTDFDRGLMEFFRELPGLLLILILAVLYMFSAETMLKIGAVIMIIGHVMNIVMGFLSVVVHGVRLNLLEFSGQLNMEWSGTAYDPFRKLDQIKK